MRNMKGLLLGLAGLALVVTAAPAAAQEGTFEFVFPPPDTVEYCYTTGFWAWDGADYVWVPQEIVCDTEEVHDGGEL